MHQMYACYRKHELIKKRAYEREIENASFTPLVLSATGGLAVEATVFYKRLASLLAMKWTKISNPVHSWCPLKRWSSHEDTAPYGPGYVRTVNQLNSATLVIIFAIICPFILSS